MRLAKFIGLLLMVFTMGAGYAQTHPENSFNAERDPAESVKIYPNPAASVEYVYIKVDHIPAKTVKLTLHNILGNAITIESEVVNDHELRVRVKDLAAGYYLLAVKNEETNYGGTFRFLKI